MQLTKLFLLFILFLVPLHSVLGQENDATKDEATSLKIKADSLFYSHQFDEAILIYEDILDIDPEMYTVLEHLTKAYANIGEIDYAMDRSKKLYVSAYQNTGNNVYMVGYHCRMALFETLKQNYKKSAANADSLFIYGSPDDIIPGPPACAFRFQALGGNVESAQKNIMLVMNEVPELNKALFLPWAIYITRQAGQNELANQLLGQAKVVKDQVESGQLDETLQELGFPEMEKHFWLAMVKAQIGNSSGAVESLEAAYEHGHRWYYRVLNEYKMFEGVYDDPDFKNLMDSIKADIDAMNHNVMAEMGKS